MAIVVTDRPFLFFASCLFSDRPHRWRPAAWSRLVTGWSRRSAPFLVTAGHVTAGRVSAVTTLGQQPGPLPLATPESLSIGRSLAQLKSCGPVLEAPFGGGAGLGRDRPRADPAARWRALVRGAGPAGSGRRPEELPRKMTWGSLATGPGYRRWDSDGGSRHEARSLGRWTRWPE